ncbi:MAG TPA: hypothetical protein VN894_14295, partial [Polyangiaceae bacterium]|nr:hypothetical protein [Polyangiaceae bacterium]
DELPLPDELPPMPDGGLPPPLAPDEEPVPPLSSPPEELTPDPAPLLPLDPVLLSGMPADELPSAPLGPVDPPQPASDTTKIHANLSPTPRHPISKTVSRAREFSSSRI